MTETPFPEHLPPSDRPLDNPRLIPFLPLLYLAWADGELSDEEAGEICRRVSAIEGLDGDCRHVLGPWLDPAHRPGPRELQALLATIRRTVADLPGAVGQPVREWAGELARVAGREISAAEEAALAALEEALEITGPEAARRLLGPARIAGPPPATTPEAVPEIPFDPAALGRLLDGPEHELRGRLRDEISRPPLLWEPAELRAEYREEVLERLNRLAAEGYGALALPDAYGGRDDIRSFLATFETLAFGDLSLLVKFGVQFGLFAGALHQLGTEVQHRKYLQDAGTARLPGCFAMTETGHGSNVADLCTRARWDPDRRGFILTTPDREARKDYIGNAACHGRTAVVFAQLAVGEEEHGVHAFVVPIRDAAGQPLPGVRIEDCGAKMGLNGVDNGRLAFDEVFVPREDLLDRFGRVREEGVYESPIANPSKRFFTMLGTLVGGRVSVALASLSASKRALAIAVRHGDRRRQFGPEGTPEVRILDYLTHQRRLLPRLATTYALHFSLRQLAEHYADSLGAEDRRQLEAEAAGLKAYATWHATETLQSCRECCGGAGYLAESHFAALKADTDVFTTFEGDNTVLLQLLAKGLLTGYRREFGSMSLFGQARHLAAQAALAVTELAPKMVAATGEEHLRDRDFAVSTLRFRERHLLSSAAGRLRARIRRGEDSFQALLACQDHLLSLARAHVERVVYERFADAVEACPEPSLRAALLPLRDLYALSRIEADRGWYLAHHHLAAAEAKAIRDLINQLCRSVVRPLAVPLVDAFLIPDALLPAIAR